MNSIPLYVLINAYKSLTDIRDADISGTVKGITDVHYTELIRARQSLGYYIEQLTAAQQVEVQS